MQEIVVRRLWALGRAQGLTARGAAELAAQLCMLVMDAATKASPEPLEFTTFMKLLDQAGVIEMPRSALLQAGGRRDAISQLVANSLRAGDGELPALAESTESFATPVLGGKVWRRQELIERVRSALATGVAYVDGSAGMGKTTLVLQAVEGKNPLLWVGLRDSTVGDVAEICRGVVQSVAETRGEPTVVLDGPES